MFVFFVSENKATSRLIWFLFIYLSTIYVPIRFNYLQRWKYLHRFQQLLCRKININKTTSQIKAWQHVSWALTCVCLRFRRKRGELLLFSGQQVAKTITMLQFPIQNVTLNNMWRVSDITCHLFIILIMSHHVTVSKLAWPASSGAAALAASCLSEWPVPWVVGMSTREIRQLHIIIEQPQIIKTHRIKQSYSTYSSWVWVPIM